jgi:hemoglobin
LDIESREDLYKIVSLFYQKLLTNDLMEHFFVAFLEFEPLEQHLSIVVDFWSGVLSHSGSYAKNALQPHIKMHRKESFIAEYFERWMLLFKGGVNQLYQGKNAEVLKHRAESIREVMQLKVLHS